MTIETAKKADNSYDMEHLIHELTTVVEREVSAFRILLDGLLEHQQSIVHGSSEAVSESQQKVEKLVFETRKIRNELEGKKQTIADALNVDGGSTVTEMLAMVEGEYVSRLTEMKDMLNTLSAKIHETNSRNQYLLNHSLRFVDSCMKTLVQGGRAGVAYSKGGTVQSGQSSLYRGIG